MPKRPRSNKTASVKRSYREEAPRIASSRRMRVRMRRVFLWSTLFLLSGGAAGGWWWLHTGHAELFYNQAKRRVFASTADLGPQYLHLKLQDIFIEGQQYTHNDEILEALEAQRGEPVLGIDLHNVKKRLETLPWVQNASVERQLPSTLHIHLIERTPMALWQQKGKLFVMDSMGNIIQSADADAFSDLMIVVGDDAPAYTAGLIATLAEEPDLHKRVTSAIRVGQRRWNVRLDNRIEIKLPEENAVAAWKKLAELQRKEKILEKGIVAVDLRLADKVSIVHPSDKKLAEEERS